MNQRHELPLILRSRSPGCQRMTMGRAATIPRTVPCKGGSEGGSGNQLPQRIGKYRVREKKFVSLVFVYSFAVETNRPRNPDGSRGRAPGERLRFIIHHSSLIISAKERHLC